MNKTEIYQSLDTVTRLEPVVRQFLCVLVLVLTLFVLVITANG